MLEPWAVELQVAATAGCEVKVYDAQPDALLQAETGLDRILSRLVEKGKLNESQKDQIQSNIQYVHSLGELGETQLVIEAIVEKFGGQKKKSSRN